MTKFNLITLIKAAGLCVLLLFASCWSQNRKYVISDRRFVDFLVDLHIAEATGSQTRRMLGIQYDIDSASLYGSVFRKHNITQAMFDSTLMFYSRKPEKFKKIFETVTTRLQSLEQILSEEEKALEKSRNLVLWKSDSTYVFKETADKVEIIVPLRGPGLYTVSATVKMLPDDASLDPRMSVYFWRNDGTPEGKQLRFQETRYTLRNGQEFTYRAIRRIDSTNYTHIRGFIANYSNADTVFNRNMVIKDISISKQVDTGSQPTSPTE
jgi:hypothetical protein